MSDFLLCDDIRPPRAKQHQTWTDGLWRLEGQVVNIVIKHIVLPRQGDKKYVVYEHQNCCLSQFWGPLALSPVINTISPTKAMRWHVHIGGILIRGGKVELIIISVEGRKLPWGGKTSGCLTHTGLLVQQGHVVHQENGLQINIKIISWKPSPPFEGRPAVYLSCASSAWRQWTFCQSQFPDRQLCSFVLPFPAVPPASMQYASSHVNRHFSSS